MFENEESPFDLDEECLSQAFSINFESLPVVETHIFKKPEPFFPIGSCHDSRKRKFPGPAGNLPHSHTYHVSFLEEAEVVPTQEERGTQCSLYNFNEPEWQAMCKDFDYKNMLQQYNVAWIKKNAAWSQLDDAKVPFLGAVVKDFECINLKEPTITATLMDTTGEIKAIFHQDIYKEHQTELTAGSVIVLKQFGVLTLGANHYLAITLNNVVNIYSRSKEQLANITQPTQTNHISQAAANITTTVVQTVTRDELLLKNRSSGLKFNKQHFMDSTVLNEVTNNINNNNNQPLNSVLLTSSNKLCLQNNAFLTKAPYIMIQNQQFLDDTVVTKSNRLETNKQEFIDDSRSRGLERNKQQFFENSVKATSRGLERNKQINTGSSGLERNKQTNTGSSCLERNKQFIGDTGSSNLERNKQQFVVNTRSSGIERNKQQFVDAPGMTGSRGLGTNKQQFIDNTESSGNKVNKLPLVDDTVMTGSSNLALNKQLKTNENILKQIPELDYNLQLNGTSSDLKGNKRQLQDNKITSNSLEINKKQFKNNTVAPQMDVLERNNRHFKANNAISTDAFNQNTCHQKILNSISNTQSSANVFESDFDAEMLDFTLESTDDMLIEKPILFDVPKASRGNPFFKQFVFEGREAPGVENNIQFQVDAAKNDTNLNKLSQMTVNNVSQITINTDNSEHSQILQDAFEGVDADCLFDDF